ncbi:hypothetical protein C7212DRAFT_26485, partial [Tuber magnatum]
ILTLEKAHIGIQWFSTHETEREIIVMHRLAFRHEIEAERLCQKLYEEELNDSSSEEAHRKLIPYFMAISETVEEVYTRVGKVCEEKASVQETIKSIIQMMSWMDLCMRLIDGKLYLLNSTQPSSPLIAEVLSVLSN